MTNRVTKEGFPSRYLITFLQLVLKDSQDEIMKPFDFKTLLILITLVQNILLDILRFLKEQAVLLRPERIADLILLAILNKISTYLKGQNMLNIHPRL